VKITRGYRHDRGFTLRGTSGRSEFDGPVPKGDVHDLVGRQLVVAPLVARPEDQSRHMRMEYAGIELLERSVLLLLRAVTDIR
jgi:hypothetical protein